MFCFIIIYILRLDTTVGAFDKYWCHQKAHSMSMLIYKQTLETINATTSPQYIRRVMQGVILLCCS